MDDYLDLMAKTLSGFVYPESAWREVRHPRWPKTILVNLLQRRGYSLVQKCSFEPIKRINGEDWPLIGYTMIGLKRLSNIRHCIETAISEDVRGDFVECGVWRGGGSIFARAVLKAMNCTDRKVWLADSFEGMPEQSIEDMVDPALAGQSYLAVSLEDVRAAFDRFDLLDEQVRFIKGWFSDSLPNAPIESISVLRLDGDYYSSTMDCLNSLYHKVSLGGFVIIDDYYNFTSCRKAVDEFLSKNNKKVKINAIDNVSVYWRVAI